MQSIPNRHVAFAVLALLVFLVLIYVLRCQTWSSASTGVMSGVLWGSLRKTSARDQSINIVDLRQSEPTVNFQCPLVTHEERSIPVCVYTAEEDIHVSGAMLNGNYWEGSMVSKVLRLLQVDSRLQFVDIGANIGTYTLAVGHAGVKVLAVEPNPETLRRLRKSIFMGKLFDRVTLLHNAVSNEHTEIKLGMDVTNRGDTYLVSNISCSGLTGEHRCVQTTVKTITLDDLLPLMTANRAIIKIDVQGSEIKVFDPRTAGAFFANVDVIAVLMEWMNYSVGSKYPLEMRQKFVEFFFRHNFSVYNTNFDSLGKNSDVWPQEIFFIKKHSSA